MVSFTTATATAIFTIVLFMGESQGSALAVPMINNKPYGIGMRSPAPARRANQIFERTIGSQLPGCIKALRQMSPSPKPEKLGNDRIIFKNLPPICITEVKAFKSNPKNAQELKDSEVIISGNTVTVAVTNAELIDGLDG